MIDLNNFPIDITYQIRHFRDFLVMSWPFLDKMMANHDWDNDAGFSEEWIQVNWEFLVERELLGDRGRLVPLELSQRVTSPTSSATHKVVCEVDKTVELQDWIKKRFNYQGEELLIVSFRSPYETTFGMYPPFNYIKARSIDRKKIYMIPFDSCRFLLMPITSLKNDL